ncbi:hypothetical protein QKU48_gp1315 [Fadolivirus algeromassiliense]|jgi:hypothetical protein|uniref:Uncharacterized protein n=1 Tax=Fadolivirus FV1/VV64 TaxID=3070911 RepID=A0A7D3URL7_9VIRU|nr:hypothetical protein QKU48_gp1315 [Fadolivirus algeromassiliense]QKF94773.1 hypothetical protein Fadolivirus_1_1315 [Fadolivirus FV1/VV64]
MQQYTFIVTHKAKLETPKFTLLGNEYLKDQTIDNYSIRMIDDKLEIKQGTKPLLTGYLVENNYPITKTGLYNDNKQILKTYYLNSFAGGRFVIYNDDMAELTIYGSGRPIISSVLGYLKK